MENQPKEKPILFSGDMVRALLAGNKTMTRRAIKERHLDKLAVLNMFPDFKSSPEDKTCPYGMVGDMLWVREGFLKERQPGNEGNPIFGRTVYTADLVPDEFVGGTRLFAYNDKAPSIHLHKAKSRIWLEITDVKVERVQDISEDDILKEGVRYPVSDREGNGLVHPMFELGKENSALSFMPAGFSLSGGIGPTSEELLKAHWAELWCKINGRESWDANPWVWAISFKVLSTDGRPIDA